MTRTRTIQAESFNAQNGVQTEASDAGGGQNIGWLANGDWARYDGVELRLARRPRDFVARVASGAGGGVSGLVEVRLDSPTGTRRSAASRSPTPAAGRAGARCPATSAAVTGTHTVYLTFTSGQPADFVNVNWFNFRN